MSMDWPLNFLPKGESSADHEDAARRLSPLRRLVQRLQLESYPREGLSELDDASRRRLLTVEGTPLSWMYLGLESGLLWQVPGNRIERPDYDPRVRPWYRNAVDASNQRPVWGAPYVEATTFRKVVPCSVEMRDPQGRRLGVASLDMMFDYIIDTMMMVPGIDDDAQTTYIVDAQGQILVDSSESRRGDGSEALDGARATRHFHVPEVIASMAQSETALVEVERSGEEFLYGVAPMQVAGWWFIVEVKTSTVLASEL